MSPKVPIVGTEVEQGLVHGESCERVVVKKLTLESEACYGAGA